MKNKKILIGIIAVIVVLVIGIVITVFVLKNGDQEKAKNTLIDFFALIEKQDYEGMYQKTIDMNMSKDDFISRNRNIYEGIDAANIKIDVTSVNVEDGKYKIKYHEKMDTSAGSIEFDNVADLKKQDGEFKIYWDDSYIFPSLGADNKVRVSTVKSTRGSILDRNGVDLAKDGKISEVGLVPGKLGNERQENISKVSELTGVSVEYINKQLSQSWVTDDTFVPVKKLKSTESELENSLLEIPGVQVNKVDGRVYSLGEEAAHLVGYVQSVTAEDLEKHQGEGYTSTSVIGKSGLELVYEDLLRGINGTEIYITDSNGNKIQELAKQDKKDGENITLTIDSSLQKQVYNQMKNDKGLFVIMEPKTGELLALVSTPSYDSNDFTVGLSQEKWDELNNDEANPLYNRFIQKYCPGSTFKAVTGAIGLTTGDIDPNKDYGYQGTSWQKDSSWGNYYVTTLTGYNGPKNLLNGIIHSDNIYFAMSALNIGADKFAESLNKLGFNESLDFPLSLAKSQYAVDNGNKIEGETRLADTGYGQGSLLVNPIHMASIYSGFANEGNMIKPILLANEEKSQVWKENVFTVDAANTIKEDLIQTIENVNGNAKDMKIEGLTIARKNRNSRT